MSTMERVVMGQKVYYTQPQKGWLLGVVTAVFGKESKVQIRDDETKATKTIHLRDVHGYMQEAYDPEDPDLFHLGDLHVATTLFCLKHRFEELQQQYSLMGEMVISINPFRLMAFNGEDERESYLNSMEPEKLPPHIWQVSHRAYSHIILRNLGNQSVVISGESGSGKTENTKMLISYLGRMSYMHSSNAMQKSVAEEIAASLQWSNPVLESFGNARTLRNDNSSRFGKYIKLYFDTASGVMVGGSTVTYLLEKSRIIMQSTGERNYHIFYEMLAGLSDAEKEELGGLKKAQDYRCLNGGKVFTRRGINGLTLDDAKEFKQVRQGLTSIGVDASTQKSIFNILASILHLMELRFESDQNDKARIVNEEVFDKACGLLKLDSVLLHQCFLVKSRTSIVTLLANKSEAESLRNAFCKALYVGLFEYLVQVVNKSIEPRGDVSDCRYIGLLDIFGFEIFQQNSFEQLCINYANESLQNHYNKYVLFNDEAECNAEGIHLPKIDILDNSECIDMFDQKKFGIFSMLDEECNFKGGSVERFTSGLWERWGSKNKYFVQPKSTVPNQFGINHYSSFVNYNTDEWLEKNSDPVNEEVFECLFISGDPFIQELLSNDVHLNKRKQTVALRFQRQLKELRTELESTETQFIRCIKPNMEASPTKLDNFLVVSQLESAGVLQTIALKRTGYPVRRLIEPFCRYFHLIAFRSTVSLLKARNYKAAANDFLSLYQRMYNWGTPNYAVGNTKVFLRAEVWSSLDRLLLRRKKWLFRRCVPFFRRWIASHRKEKRIREERRLDEIRKAREELDKKSKEIKKHGITKEDLTWIEGLMTIFPNLAIDTIIDVVVFFPKREQTISALAELQEQRIDEALSSTFMRVMHETEMRPCVIHNLLSKNITTVEKLAACDQETLKQYGMHDAEVALIARKLLKERSQRVRIERLQKSIGTVNLNDVLTEAKRQAAAASSIDFDANVARLVEIGFQQRDAVLALTHYSGDVERAGEMLLRGDVANHSRAPPTRGKGGRWTSLDAEVQKIVRLGVTKDNAKRALRHANGDVDEAVKLIFQ